MTESVSITNNGVKPYRIVISTNDKVMNPPEPKELPSGESLVVMTEYVTKIEIGLTA